MTAQVLIERQLASDTYFFLAPAAAAAGAAALAAPLPPFLSSAASSFFSFFFLPIVKRTTFVFGMPNTLIESAHASFDFICSMRSTRESTLRIFFSRVLTFSDLSRDTVPTPKHCLPRSTERDEKASARPDSRRKGAGIWRLAPSVATGSETRIQFATEHAHQQRRRIGLRCQCIRRCLCVAANWKSLRIAKSCFEQRPVSSRSSRVVAVFSGFCRTANKTEHVSMNRSGRIDGRMAFAMRASTRPISKA